MKKILSLSLLAASFITASVNAQDCEIYKDYKEGSSIKTVSYDTKDRPQGFTVSTVKEKKNIDGGVSILFHQKYDNMDDYTFESEFDISCVNGDVKVNMAKMLDPTTMTAYKDMEFEVLADDLSIPANASPGDVLNDGTVTVKVNTGTPVNVSISVTLTNRVVEGREEVTTPAGTFDCTKITYDMLTKVGFVKIRTSAAEYYDKNNGVIKTESFSKNGKISGYTLVEEIIN